MEKAEEGGLSWLVVTGAFFVQFIALGLNYSVGMLQVELMQILNKKAFLTSWFPAVLFSSTAVSGISSKFIVRRCSPRVSVVCGGVISAFGFGSCYFVTDLYHIVLLGGLVGGFGLGLTYLPSLMAVEQHFVHRRIIALCLCLSGLGLGMIGFSLLVPLLVELLSWRGAMLVLAACCFQLVAAGCLLLPRPHSVLRAEQRQLPHGFSCSCHQWQNRKMIDFSCLCVSSLLWAFGTTSVYTHIPAYAQSMAQISLMDCGLLIGFIGMASFVSRLLFSVVGHGSKIDIFVSFFCTVLLTTMLTFLQKRLFEDFTGQVTYCLVFGFFVGYWMTVTAHYTREHVGEVYSAEVGSYLILVTALGAFLGPAATGLLVERRNYADAFYLSGGTMMAASCILILCKVIPVQQDVSDGCNNVQLQPLEPLAKHELQT